MRRCLHCHDRLPHQMRGDARYCSTRCRVAAHRARRRDPVPTELVDRRRWVRYRGRMPLTVDGQAASSTDPDTWSDHATAVASDVGDGRGFVLNGDGVVCVDLDHCFDNGKLAVWAEELLDLAGETYVEVSPSGDGLHIWGTGHVPRGRRRNRPDGGAVEVYGTGRYLTVTGRTFRDAPSKLGNLDVLVDRLMDEVM